MTALHADQKSAGTPAAKRQGASRLANLLCLIALLLPAASAQAEDGAAPESSLPVRVEVVGEASGTATRHFVGRLEAVSTVDLSFEVGGRLAKLPVREGQVVSKGDLVAALDPTDFELAVRQAEVQRTLALKELARYRKLLKRDNVSQQAFDRAQADFSLRDVALDQARRNLDYATIEAPFRALVTRRLIDNFSAVQPKQNIVRIQNVTEIRVAIHVPEQLIHLTENVNAINAVAVFPFAKNFELPLEYREHETEPDPVTQTYKVTFGAPIPENVPSPDKKTILPGMTCSVRIQLAENKPDAVSVPLSAVDTDSKGGTRVWVLDKEKSTAAPHPVTLGPVRSERVVILQGLKKGETIVTAGTRLLHEGVRVHAVERF